MLKSTPDNPDGAFDHSLAGSYIGKNLLFGITYCDHNENVLRQTQNYGEIIEINEHVMLVKLQGSDETFTLPPFVAELEPAPEGEYKLRSTGQIIVNPDLLGRFQVIAPASENTK